MPARKVTFEKVREDANGKVWHIEAIHNTTTRNNRKYSREELTLGARSLSYRPIDINHDESRYLPYDYINPLSPNSNSTIIMDFIPEANGVVGDVWITDKVTNARIEAGEIKTVSIEQIPYKGESCSCMVDKCTCEQHGVVFTAIAFLETFKGVEPGDVEAGKFTRKESKKEDDSECPEGKHKDKDGKCVPDEEDKAEAEDEECPEGSHKGDDGKCVKDEDPKEEGCGCALSKALGKELYAELKRAEHFAKTGELK